MADGWGLAAVAVRGFGLGVVSGFGLAVVLGCFPAVDGG